MKQVTDVAVLQDAILRVDRGDADFTISLFASKEKMETWIADGTLWIFPYKDALLIQRNDGTLMRIFHVAPNQQSLLVALSNFVESMPDQTIVADLVGRSEDVARVTSTYEESGFFNHERLLRMHRIAVQNTTVNRTADVELANMGDVPKLHAFMERWLDPLSEQIQNFSELQDVVASEGVFVVRDGDGLSGILVYETKGQSTVLRYWYVAAHRHGIGIGSRLMHAFLAHRATSRRITLWVIASNTDAIAKYHHYGFAQDGMTDNIMVVQQKQANQ